VTFVVAMLAILNPIGNAALFLGLMEDAAQQDYRREAIKTAIAVCLILWFSVWFGLRLLHLFEISVSAFTLAGGVIIFLIGLKMVQGKTHTHHVSGSRTNNQIDTEQSIAVVPMSMPIIAGPGAISTLVMHSSVFPTVSARLEESIICLILAFLVGLVLAIAPTVARLLGHAGMKIVTRLMGLVIASIAVQMILGGITTAFLS